MKKDINKCIEIYKSQLENESIQIAYITLMRYIAELKATFPNKYKTGNISPGYLDYTYFPFFNDYLRKHKLRFGIVLNHKKMKFELWLMGQNEILQKEYWNILKNTSWNKDKLIRPKYAVLEVSLLDKIDFNNKEKMTTQILGQTISLAKEIQIYLENK
jgi:hypothetical protein